MRERKQQEDLTLICQMLAGCSTTVAAYLAGRLPDSDDGTHFLIWFYQWMGEYHRKKGQSFEGLRDGKRLQRGVVVAPAA